jgi:hypothetical protein
LLTQLKRLSKGIPKNGEAEKTSSIPRRKRILAKPRRV